MNHDQYLYEYSQKNLRECQLKQLSILKEIDRICKKHQIVYWLDGGTILGAVRHGGFIPWDDDIDIAIAEKDLRRFEEVAPQELREGLFLQNGQTDPYAKEPIVKVRDTNSLFIERGDHFEQPYAKGIYVDFFPFVSHPDIPARWMKRLGRGISKSNSILQRRHYYSLRSFAEFFWFGAQRTLYQLLWNVLCAVCKSTHYGNVPTNNGYGITHRRDSVLPVSSISFEGETFPAPANPDQYLREIYGDYMEVPPVEKRKFHSVFILPRLHDDKQ